MCFFKAPHPYPPPFIIITLYGLVHYLPRRFSTVLSVQCDGCWAAGAGFLSRAGLVVGLQVGQALGCSGCLGLGSSVPVPHVLGHPTSICDEGINILLLLSLDGGAYHNFMFVLGFILSRHLRLFVTGSHRRLRKFDFQEETKSYFVKL